MKRLASGALVIFLVASLLLPVACGKAANAAPAAYVDSITPSPATAGEAVTFNGHGTDSDGTVVAYSWNSSLDGVIGTTAFLTTSSLSAGTHTISFKVQDNTGAWSGAVTAQFVVEEEAGMEGAVDVVVEEILPDIPEVQGGNPYICLKLDSILPGGTIIEEDSGQTLKLTLQEDSYFFYLDLEPGAFYEHPVKYIIVDEDGNHNEYEAKWWPRINNQVPPGLVKTIPDDNDVIAANVELKQPSGIQMVFDFPVLPLQLCEGFIVVQGLMPWENLYDCSVDDYLNRIDFFNAYKTSCSEVEGLVEGQAIDVFDEIDSMVEAGLNPITISIVAHGGDNYIKLSGQTVWVSQFRNKMAEYPDTTFNFILTSCHSGSFMDELETLDNICVISTASRADESAWPDWDTASGQNDYNPSDVGAEWTSSIVEAMSVIVEDTEKFDTVVSMAREYGTFTTCVLICEAHYGALGANAGFGLTQDLDLSHRVGSESPQLYCSWETIY